MGNFGTRICVWDARGRQVHRRWRNHRLILVARRRLVALAVIIAILVVIDGISTISRVNDYTVSAFGQEVHPASTGWGLWLTVISGVALAIGGSRLRSEQQQKKIEEKVDRELDEEEAAASSQ